MTLNIDKFREELNKKLHPEVVREDDVGDDSYENVVFLQGEEAEPYLKMLNDAGAEEVVRNLVNGWYNPGEHEVVSGNPAGAGDQTFEVDDGKFILSWNDGIGYIGLIAKTDVNESCGAGTASVPGSCGADTGIARFKAPIGGVQRRIEETNEQEGNEEPSGGDNAVVDAPNAKAADVSLPSWLDTEAVESAAHFMFRGFSEDTIKKFVEDACTDCSGTEEALFRLKEYSKTDKTVSNKSFNEEEMDSLGTYRHSLRSKLFGGAKNAILDPDDYLNAKKTNEADVGAPMVTGASSQILPTQGQMSVNGSNNEIKRANIDIEIAKKNADLAQEVDPSKRKKIYDDLSRLEGQKGMLKESSSVYFPSVYEWNQGKFPLSQPAQSDEETLNNVAKALGVQREAIRVVKTLDSSDPVNVKFPNSPHGISVGKLFNNGRISRVYFTDKQAVEDALKANKGKQENVAEGENVSNFTKSGDAVSYSFEEAIEMLSSRLGVDENVFEIIPSDADTKAVFLNTKAGKKKIADVVESHGGKFITYLNFLDNPELEDMLSKDRFKNQEPVEEDVMKEKDDIDKKTIVGVLLTAGPEKVSKAFATAASQGQEQFYQLVNGIDVDGLKILSKGVQGTAQQNVDQGVSTPTADDAPPAQSSGGIEPGDSTNPQSGGSELKDL